MKITSFHHHLAQTKTSKIKEGKKYKPTSNGSIHKKWIGLLSIRPQKSFESFLTFKKRNVKN